MRPQKNRGGTLKETTLWTNPSPTSSMPNDTYVTLPQSYKDFDYLGVYFWGSTTDQTEHMIMCPSSMLDNALTSSGFRFGWMNYTGSMLVTRNLWRTNNTDYIHLTIGRGERTSGTGWQNTYAIPLKIVGLKYQFAKDQI